MFTGITGETISGGITPAPGFVTMESKCFALGLQPSCHYVKTILASGLNSHQFSSLKLCALTCSDMSIPDIDKFHSPQHSNGMEFRLDETQS